MEDTKFAPAERSVKGQVESERQILDSLETFRELFGSLNSIAAILNENRQVIYSNASFLTSLGIGSVEEIVGKRPGEIVSCIHAEKEPGGCGTSEFCRYCGAVTAIIESQKLNKKIEKEARLTVNNGGRDKSMELRVSSAPVSISGAVFYMFSITDISSEKRKEALERIFFHDILNIAGGLNGLLEILKSVTDPAETEELINMSEAASRNLLEEILIHRQLRAAENGDLKPDFEKLKPSEIINSAIARIKHHDTAKNKEIRISGELPETDFVSDRLLLQRVLINLIKNALEATDEGGTVNIGCYRTENKTAFFVRNLALMPAEIKAQIFQRSFSTKGKGRGIGTYSIKLIAESYLNGAVSFMSNSTDGTIFTVEIPD